VYTGMHALLWQQAAFEQSESQQMLFIIS
jgi:hypothetical protein